MTYSEKKELNNHILIFYETAVNINTCSLFKWNFKDLKEIREKCAIKEKVKFNKLIKPKRNITIFL